jgi:hypothetical protein
MWPGEELLTMRPNDINVLRIAIACGAMMIAGNALAFRCGNRLVKEGMAESQVIELCGEPESTRHLGYKLRPYIIKRPAGQSSLSGSRHIYAGFHEEVLIKEMLFNFGPRKLMRVVRFEGGRMVTVETAGYGHPKEKK